MSPPDANAILRWSFNDDAKSRMEALMDRNGRGELTEPELDELEAYVNVGQVIGTFRRRLVSL